MPIWGAAMPTPLPNTWAASTRLMVDDSCGHLGDTVETVSRTYVHWLRDDRDIPAQVLDRMLSPASSARHEASGEGT